MKRRNLLKSFLAAPFLGLLRGRTPSVSGDHSQLSSSSNSKLKCPDCPDEDESEFCQDPTCPYEELKDGKWLKGDEMECLRCGRVIKLEKGYYRFGDRIECECGNRAKFVMFAELMQEK